MEAEKMVQLVAAVGAILQMAKAIPQLEKIKAWLPVLSVALGVALAFVWSLDEPVIAGIMIGLTASGSYDFLKPKKAA